jgi:hypothetical protein
MQAQVLGIMVDMGYSAPVGLHRVLRCDCSQTGIVEKHPLVAHLKPLDYRHH